jgi:hypothetical protein
VHGRVEQRGSDPDHGAEATCQADHVRRDAHPVQSSSHQRTEAANPTTNLAAVQFVVSDQRVERRAGASLFVYLRTEK